MLCYTTNGPVSTATAEHTALLNMLPNLPKMETQMYLSSLQIALEITAFKADHCNKTTWQQCWEMKTHV